MDHILPTSQASPGRWRLEVRDRKGSLLGRSEGPMRSYVANFLRMLRAQIRNASVTATDQTGVARTWTAGQTSFAGIRGAVGTFRQGIIIGTSPRAVVGTDFKMGSPWLHGGTTANRFTYNQGTWVQQTLTTGTTSFRYQRVFTNNTAAPQTVNEIGIGVESKAGENMLIIRDVVTPTVVNPLTSLTVTYDLYTVA